MQTPLFHRLGALALFALGACVTLDDEEDARARGLRMAELGDMVNVSVCGDVWLGAHASAQDLGIASRRGIETVIDLRARVDPGRLDVPALCRSLGMGYVRAELDPAAPSDDAVDRVLGELAREPRGDVLMLCDDGARCATVFAIYRVVEQGVDVEDALEEARRCGLKPGVGEAAIRFQLGRLLPE